MGAALEKDKTLFHFDCYSNLNVNTILNKGGYFLRMTMGRRALMCTTFPLMQREDHKFILGYHPTLEEIVKAMREAQAQKTATRRG